MTALAHDQHIKVLSGGGIVFKAREESKRKNMQNM